TRASATTSSASVSTTCSSPAQWGAGRMCARAEKSARVLLLAALALTAWASCCRAGGEPAYSPTGAGFLAWFDWGREPDDLPSRSRTNCGIHTGRFYCAYRCGTTYQFYYCTRTSFGCCHIGDGYCDDRGLLRCRP